MSLRVCTRCGESRESEQFAWKSKAKGKRHAHCKPCQKSISNKHYLGNKDEYIDRAKKRYADVRDENLDNVKIYLQDKICESCNNSNTEVLGFVHRNPESRKDTINRLLGQNWDVVKSEIEKCKILCKTCQRKFKKK